MTAGHGICHAEVSPPDAPPRLHGVQLWVALPDEVRDTTPAAFDHLADLPGWSEDGVDGKVLVGALAGSRSPAPSYSPLVGAEIRLAPGARTEVPLERGFEYGVLTAEGTTLVDGAEVARNQMTYLGTGRPTLLLKAPRQQDGDTVLLLLGGEPFEEEIVMWWNFIGRSHDEVVAQREDWNGGGISWRPPRFGEVTGFAGDRLLAPPMPNVRLRSRGR